MVLPSFCFAGLSGSRSIESSKENERPTSCRKDINNDKYEYNDSNDEESCESEDVSDSEQVHQKQVEDRHVAIACDDGAVRIYTIFDSDKLIYHKSLPRVSGEISTPEQLFLLGYCF